MSDRLELLADAHAAALVAGAKVGISSRTELANVPSPRGTELLKPGGTLRWRPRSRRGGQILGQARWSPVRG